MVKNRFIIIVLLDAPYFHKIFFFCVLRISKRWARCSAIKVDEVRPAVAKTQIASNNSDIYMDTGTNKRPLTSSASTNSPLPTWPLMFINDHYWCFNMNIWVLIIIDVLTWTYHGYCIDTQGRLIVSLQAQMYIFCKTCIICSFSYLCCIVMTRVHFDLFFFFLHVLHCHKTCVLFVLSKPCFVMKHGMWTAKAQAHLRICTVSPEPSWPAEGSLVERPLCDRKVAGLIPGEVIPKTLKMVLVALSPGAQHQEGRARTAQLSVSIMSLGGISCQSVWGMIFQWGSTLKVSIELPATSRHRRDMTERGWKRR